VLTRVLVRVGHRSMRRSIHGAASFATAGRHAGPRPGTTRRGCLGLGLKAAAVASLPSWAMATPATDASATRIPALAARCAASVDGSRMLTEATPKPVRAELARLLDTVAAVPPDAETRVAERIERLGTALLDRPYAWNPIGEGPGQFDPDPPFDLQRFDCMTWLETVIALARARCLDDVFDDLWTLRYGRATPSFETRTHFVSVDWLPAAHTGALLRKPEALIERHAPMRDVHALIDKPGWFARLGRNRMYRHLLQGQAPADALARLEAWGRTLSPVPTRLRVMAPDALFAWAERSHRLPAPERLPRDAVLFVLRPDAPFNRSTGGGDPVSHVGFVMPEADGRHAAGPPRWMLRSASQQARGVTDVPLRSALRTTPTQGAVLGVAIALVQPRA
jgi:hypothetical protein